MLYPKTEVRDPSPTRELILHTRDLKSRTPLNNLPSDFVQTRFAENVLERFLVISFAHLPQKIFGLTRVSLAVLRIDRVCHVQLYRKFLYS